MAVHLSRLRRGQDSLCWAAPGKDILQEGDGRSRRGALEVGPTIRPGEVVGPFVDDLAGWRRGRGVNAERVQRWCHRVIASDLVQHGNPNAGRRAALSERLDNGR